MLNAKIFKMFNGNAMKIWKFGKGNIVTVDKQRDTKLIFGLEIMLEILIVSTKR